MLKFNFIENIYLFSEPNCLKLLAMVFGRQVHGETYVPSTAKRRVRIFCRADFFRNTARLLFFKEEGCGKDQEYNRSKRQVGRVHKRRKRL